MGKGKQDKASNEKHPEEKVFWIVGLGMLTMAIVPGIFAFFFHSLNWGGPKDWATFATYFSGIATPVVALCSALLFYRSIIVQRDEFEKTRQEMEVATKHQIEVEQARQNIVIQEQIERALPIAEAERKKIFTQLGRFPDGYRDASMYQYSNRGFDTSPDKLKLIKTRDDTASDMLAELVSKYIEVARHAMQMIHRYLKSDGDIYLRIGDIMTLLSEFKQIQRFHTVFDFTETPGYLDYEKSLSNLKRKQEHLLAGY